jgi:hypothetical protein
MERRQFKSHLVAALAGAAIVALAVGVLVFRDSVRSAATLTKPHEEMLDLSLVINRVRGLNRLETAVMRVTHVGTISQTYTLVPNALAGDEVTLYSVGDVIAGVDLSQLGPGDVHRDPDGTVVIRLPPPQVLVSRIDNRQTHVVSRRTGVFRRADAQLEAHARQYAEQSIRNEAIHRNILGMARTNAELRIAELAHEMGAESVRFSQATSGGSEQR